MTLKVATEFEPSETKRIVKNVVIISLAFMVQFTAYGGAANLQSSINAEDGLGMSSLAAVYAGLFLSNIFLPTAVIKWIGTKWAISLSFLTYMPYIAAQLRPSFYTMIPAGLCVGLGGGPLWCAKCTYLSVVSEAHSKLSNISAEALLARFLGLFFMIFQLNQIWGNLISSLVLSSGDNHAAVTAINATMIPEICGANFLPSADAAKTLQQQPFEKIQLLSGIYLACMAAAALIVAIGVDSMTRYDTDRAIKLMGGGEMLMATLKLLAEPKQIMLITIMVFTGLQMAFFGADFTAAFVSCAVGTGTVGYVMLTCGVANSIGCFVTGYIAKITGRMPLVCAATVLHMGLVATILLWKPQANMSYVMYIIAVLWGLCDSVWLVQINALFGILFPGREEAAYSNAHLWSSVGFIIAYVISPHLRTSSKAYLLGTTMLVGVFLYFIVEFQVKKEREVKETKAPVKGLDNKAYSIAE
ncbi:UNC93-like protein [Pieris rapae]|uniref:UNC93-like protein n=1 Tax=Pieris rapae TaxID=64459 RepID=UPI001E27E140|nr:UNC93-like protein [Pieris rapae]